MNFLTSKQAVAGLTDGHTIVVSSNQAARRGVNAGNYTDPRPLSGDMLLAATIASYNQGCGNSLISISTGVDVDLVTTGGNYSKDVINRAEGFRLRYQSL